MKAALISIGDEILAGNTIDTNSNFIAAELRKIGISTVQILAISDDADAIHQALSQSLAIADVVCTTGGLGPTKDDKTKAALAAFFDDHLVSDAATRKHLLDLLQKRKREHLFELNKTQADVLSKAKIFQNDNGTAPCQMIEYQGKVVFCLPGVPHEVKPLIREQIVSFLRERFEAEYIETRAVSVVGIPESLLADKISAWEEALPRDISLSYLPVGNRIKLRLTASGPQREILVTKLSHEADKLRPLIGDQVIAWDGDKIEQIVKEVLVSRKLTISSAESCTGGQVSRVLTSVSGSGEYFLGGVVTYDFHKKIDIINVSPETIEEHTVVSAEVAQEMSLGCQRLFGTDIAVSTTGVAGPEADEFGNPVGLVYYSIRIKGNETTKKLFLPHLDRGDFVNHVSQRVLQDLVEILLHRED